MYNLISRVFPGPYKDKSPVHRFIRLSLLLLPFACCFDLQIRYSPITACMYTVVVSTVVDQ